MLGNNADHFMLSQMRERVLAITPNAGGRSFSPPDQERAGTATVRTKGGFGMPGPQRQVSSNYSPGIQPSGALPGMGGFQRSGALPGMGAFQRSGALPGMGAFQRSGALPGMGEGEAAAPTVAVSIPPSVMIGWGVAAAALFYFMSRPDSTAKSAAPAA